jgi:hypothetical protein
MQDRYAADVGDFGKFSLLRCLFGESRNRIGVIWSPLAYFILTATSEENLLREKLPNFMQGPYGKHWNSYLTPPPPPFPSTGERGGSSGKGAE